jgi:hypothetical protein
MRLSSQTWNVGLCVTKSGTILGCCMAIVRAELSKLSDEWFADPNAITCSFSGDAAEQRT